MAKIKKELEATRRDLDALPVHRSLKGTVNKAAGSRRGVSLTQTFNDAAHGRHNEGMGQPAHKQVVEELTPLESAIRSGDVATVKALIKARRSLVEEEPAIVEAAPVVPEVIVQNNSSAEDRFKRYRDL